MGLLPCKLLAHRSGNFVCERVIDEKFKNIILVKPLLVIELRKQSTVVFKQTKTRVCPLIKFHYTLRNKLNSKNVFTNREKGFKESSHSSSKLTSMYATVLFRRVLKLQGSPQDRLLLRRTKSRSKVSPSMYTTLNTFVLYD